MRVLFFLLFFIYFYPITIKLANYYKFTRCKDIKTTKADDEGES